MSFNLDLLTHCCLTNFYLLCSSFSSYVPYCLSFSHQNTRCKHPPWRNGYRVRLLPLDGTSGDWKFDPSRGSHFFSTAGDNHSRSWRFEPSYGRSFCRLHLHEVNEQWTEILRTRMSATSIYSETEKMNIDTIE